MNKLKRKITLTTIIFLAIMITRVLSAHQSQQPQTDFSDLGHEEIQAVTDMTKHVGQAIDELQEHMLIGKELSDTRNTTDVSVTNISAEFEEVTLVSIVDGDTLYVIDSTGQEIKVRLIGIDTPESVHADASKNNEYGKMASDHTKAILKDIDTLYLEYDIDQTDVYDRTLAYVWLSKDTSDTGNMLNSRILMDGYAVDKVYKPNTRYAARFAKLCQNAKQDNLGLWEYEGFRQLNNQ